MAVRFSVDKMGISAFCTTNLGFLNGAISNNQKLLLRQSSRHLCNIPQTMDDDPNFDLFQQMAEYNKIECEKIKRFNVNHHHPMDDVFFPNKYCFPILGFSRCTCPTDDEEIIKAARIAVEERNRRRITPISQNAELQFVRVVKAMKKVMGNVAYFLTLEASDGGEKKFYEVEIRSEAGKKGKFNLLQFTTVSNKPLDLATRVACIEQKKKSKVMRSQTADQSD